MKLINGICVVVVCLLFLSGCQDISHLNSAQTIKPPKNNMIPIQGTWVINDYKRISDVQEEHETHAQHDEILGKTAQFTEEWVAMADESCTEVQYQIRRVSTGDYFLFHYNVNAHELGIEGTVVDIVSITSSGVLFYDIVKINEETAVVYRDKSFYWLKKISDEVESLPAEDKKDLWQPEGKRIEEDELLRSGVLLGLRSTIPASDDGDRYGDRYTYRTIWISSYNRKIKSILESENLLIPRRSGFWTLSHRTRKIGDFIQDYIDLKPLDSLGTHPNDSDIDRQLSSYLDKNIKKNLLFVGDDYVAIEYSETERNKIKEPDTYMVLPLDHANSQKGILVSAFADEGMEDIFFKSAQSHLISNGRNFKGNIKEIGREDNFTLARRNGHWILKGRLNMDGKHEDFTIGLGPVGKLINYDELYPSWNDIKEKIPMAIDAYSSPNKDILIVVTSNFIMVYTIEEGQISQKPIKKIGIKKGDMVIMAEWATADYVARWEKSFNVLNPYIVNE